VVVDPGPPPAPEAPPGPPSPDTKNDTGQDPESDRAPRRDEPRGQLAFTLYVNEETIQGTTDQDGYVDCGIPPNVTRARLVLAPGTPHETEIKLNLGHLDPIDEISGVKQRLRNLCFDCGDQSNEETPDFAAALRAFQGKHALEPTGVLDEQTRAEILNAHGT
jgi:hypothetical protein